MAKYNANKENWVLVEINDVTHETKAIPVEKVFLQDNLTFADYVKAVSKKISELSAEVAALKTENENLKESVSTAISAVKELNQTVASVAVDVKNLKVKIIE